MVELVDSEKCGDIPAAYDESGRLLLGSRRALLRNRMPEHSHTCTAWKFATWRVASGHAWSLQRSKRCTRKCIEGDIESEVKPVP